MIVQRAVAKDGHRPVGCVLKGHGTENDFILVPDLDGSMSLSATAVRALCDRHSGIGADGVLRVVRTSEATEPDVLAQAGSAEFFMDYRNADGSIAEMCGNGVRVFARYLQHAGLVAPGAAHTTVATRGGTRSIRFDGLDVSVDMGPARLRRERPTVAVSGAAVSVLAALDLPNPHVVCEVDEDALAALDLTRAPSVTPALPEGQNVEFIARTGERSLRMRVHERGVGETRSCGTGICAAVVAAAGASGAEADPAAWSGRQWTVDVPGGRCRVSWSQTGSVILTGPAVLVGEICLDEQWLHDHR